MPQYFHYSPNKELIEPTSALRLIRIIPGLCTSITIEPMCTMRINAKIKKQQLHNLALHNNITKHITKSQLHKLNMATYVVSYHIINLVTLPSAARN